MFYKLDNYSYANTNVSQCISKWSDRLSTTAVSNILMNGCDTISETFSAEKSTLAGCRFYGVHRDHFSIVCKLGLTTKRQIFGRRSVGQKGEMSESIWQVSGCLFPHDWQNFKQKSRFDVQHIFNKQCRKLSCLFIASSGKGTFIVLQTFTIVVPLAVVFP